MLPPVAPITIVAVVAMVAPITPIAAIDHKGTLDLWVTPIFLVPQVGLKAQPNQTKHGYTAHVC